MKKLLVILMAFMLLLSTFGCSNADEENDPNPTPNTEEPSGSDETPDGDEVETPEFHYTKELYLWDSKLNDYQGGYSLIEGAPWEGYPEGLPIVGGYMDLSLGGGGPSEYSSSQYLVIFTQGGDDIEIADWYFEQLENNGWEVTNYENSEEYGSSRIDFANDDYYGDFKVESEESALGGYDGSMARSESDFEKTAVTITIYPK